MVKEKTHYNEISVVSVRLERVKGLRIAEEAINTAEIAKALFQKQIGTMDKEVFAMVCLDTKGRITHYSEVHVGSLNQAVIHPREIYKIAILSNANAILIGHNHPSGDLMPSESDKHITKTLIKVGKLLDIKLLDHIIVSDDGALSMRQAGSVLFD